MSATEAAREGESGGGGVVWCGVVGAQTSVLLAFSSREKQIARIEGEKGKKEKSKTLGEAWLPTLI